MALLVPLYAIITALSVVLFLLHMHLLAAFYLTAAALFAVAAGREFHGLILRGTPGQKIVHAIFAVAMLVACQWLGARAVVDLYYRMLSGTSWSMLGIFLGFFAERFPAGTFRRLKPRH